MSMSSFVHYDLDWQSIRYENWLAWNRVRLVLQFFDRLFPFVSLGVYTFVTSIFYRTPHCSEHGRVLFLLFWAACLLGALVSAIMDEWRHFPRHESWQSWAVMFRCARQIFIIGAEFITVSLAVNNNFGCAHAGRVILKSVLPVLLVVVPLAELMRYAVLDSDRKELIERIIRLEKTLEIFDDMRLRMGGETFVDGGLVQSAYEGELP
jgi:hypothetical protein